MNASSNVRFCPHCGTEVEFQQHFGREHPACPQCGRIFFPDPKVAAAVLIIHSDQVLLVRRAHRPFRGRWTLPAGFIDAGEDPMRAAERECLEETGLHVRATKVFDVLSGRQHLRGADITIVYLAEMLNGEILAGDDVDAARFYPFNHLPPLAFKSTRQVIERANKKID